MKKTDLKNKILRLGMPLLLALIMGCSQGAVDVDNTLQTDSSESQAPDEGQAETSDSPDDETAESEVIEPEIPQPSPEEVADAWIKEHAIYREATYVDISHTDVNGVDIDTVIERLPNLERLVMIDCGLDNDGYASLQDRHPDIKIVWEIVLSHWTIRTDSVAFSTFKTTADDFFMENDEAYYLKYCNELVALDLGHNWVSDLSFLEYMPELKILILVDNVKYKEGDNYRHLTDLSELQYVPKLRYLEIFANNVSDFSFMQYLPELEDLNISYNSVSSIQYLTGFSNLKRLWMEETYISYNNYVYLTQLYPNAQIVYFGESSIDQGWRSGPRYYAMRRMFRENIIDDLYRD